MASPPIALDDARVGDALARVRVLAAQRDGAKVLALLQETGLVERLEPDDHAVGAAALHDAARRLADGELAVADLVAAIVARVRLPERIPNTPVMVDYVEAMLAAHELIAGTAHRERAWGVLLDLLRRDLGAVPSVREHALGFAAETALVQPVPPELEAALDRHLERPYLFAEARAYLNLLAYRLDRAVAAGDAGSATSAWLLDWAHYLSSAPYARPRRMRHRRSLLEMKDAVHARARGYFKLSAIAFGRGARLRATLALLLMRLDGLIWPPTRARPYDVHIVWLAVLRFFLRRLGGRRARREPAPAIAAASPAALETISAPTLRGSAADVLVTRAQGGLGDVMMMRPGLLELARATTGGRVYFATHRDLFAVFGRDDPLTLVDIEATALDWTSFGTWVNLTECPATRVEVQQLPNVRTNRIDIFARALGVRVGAFPRRRTAPQPLDASADARADALLRAVTQPGRPVIGIQLRSAEPYRDAPQLLAIARTLSERYSVLVFDNRPIPRLPSDAFVAISDQPLQVVIALIGRLDAVITCDSLAVHLAGAYGVPCVALFGPTGGTVRCDHYPSVTVVDARASLDCIPCWRHEFSKCRTGGGFESVCMSRITVEQVETALDAALRDAAPSCASPGRAHG